LVRLRLATPLRRATERHETVTVRGTAIDTKESPMKARAAAALVTGANHELGDAIAEAPHTQGATYSASKAAALSLTNALRI
jgi:hypothetical protein